MKINKTKLNVEVKENEVFEDETLKSVFPKKLKEHSYFDIKHLEETQNNYESNNLIKELKRWFDEILVDEAIQKYRVGTLETWQDSTVFWHIDMEGRICSANVMKYEHLYYEPLGFDGKPLIDSMRSIIYKKGLIDVDFKQKDVFFGEHLLNKNTKPIAVVEH